MNAFNTVVTRCLLGALASLGAFIYTADAQVQIPAPEMSALRPIMCGSCLLASDLKVYEILIGEQPGSGLYVTAQLKHQPGRKATLDDVRAVAQGQLRLATIDPAKRASTRHVCLGSRVAMAPDTVGVDAPAPAAHLTKVAPHPDAVDGVCEGELRPIEIFLQGVVAPLFADQLAKAEKRTAPEAVNEALRNSLAEVLAQHKAELAQQIKREVVAELRPQAGAASVQPLPDLGAAEPKLERCTTGTFSCEGKPLSACCMCAGVAGTPNRRGVCEANGSLSSWRPAPK